MSRPAPPLCPKQACLAEGFDVIALEADSDIGGFWRYKEGTDQPSCYLSTHIDTDRDLNSFGDRPFAPDRPLLVRGAAPRRAHSDCRPDRRSLRPPSGG